MATAAEIRNQAATRLGELGEGQVLAPRVSEDLDKAYVQVFAQLGAKNMLVWDFDEEVPNEYVVHVVALVAFSRANDYSISNDRYQRLALDQSIAIPEIRELLTSDTYVTPQPDYF